MTLIFGIAIAALAYGLLETRRRLANLERQVDARLALLPREQAREDGAPAPAPPSPATASAKVGSQRPAEGGGPWSHPSILPAPPASAAEPALARGFPNGLEDLFGRRLPVWAGAVTLLVAAVLLVRYSIEAGLLSPWVRVFSGLGFGAALIGGAELAHRLAGKLRDPRVAQALAGAGAGAIYAAILAAHARYGLIGPEVAFAGLAATTALAMGLAMRFGVPCALLALIGGLAAPALVHSESPDVPLLAGYLAMITGSLTVLSRRQRWFWLGASALAGGLVWSVVIILAGALDPAAMAATGLLILLLGLALPAWQADSRHDVLLRAGGAVVASMQLAALVATAGFDLLSWGLYGLLSIGFLLVIERAPALRAFLVVPLLAALALAACWPEPDRHALALVLAGIALLHGGGALRLLWRADGASEQALHLAQASLGAYGVLLWHAGPTDGALALALAGFGLAILPALALVRGWHHAERHGDLRFPLLAGVLATLLAVAAMRGLPPWTAPLCIAVAAAGLLGLAERADDARIAKVGLGFAIVALLVLVGRDAATPELARLYGLGEPAHDARAVVRWAVLAMVYAAFAWRLRGERAGRATGALGAALLYGLAAQIVPPLWLAVVAGLLLVLLVEGGARLTPPAPARAAAAAMALILYGWMAGPLFAWLLPALRSLAGEPMLTSALPELSGWIRGLLAPALLAALAAWRMRGRIGALPPLLPALVAALPAGIAIHGLYKHLFALDDMARFVRLGLAERTLWEAGLVMAGLGLHLWLGNRKGALALVALGAGHALLYTGLIHNPLIHPQAVGPWPLVNLLLPSLGLLFALPAIVGRIAPALTARLAPAADSLRMVTMLLFALMTLRQLAAGSVFAGQPVDPPESLAWSGLAIAMAIGWLLWGLRQHRRTWRIGSLALMLAAIVKVFLVDASGLTGLLRIFSFLGLGFSLIGIGWLYNRALRGDAPVNPASA